MTYCVQATRLSDPSPSPTVAPPDGLAALDGSLLALLAAGADAAVVGAVVAEPPPHAAAIRASTASPTAILRSRITPPPRVPAEPARPLQGIQPVPWSRPIRDG